MSWRLPRQPSRYVVIGAICAAANNVIFIGGEALGLHYTTSVFLTFVLVLPPSYLAHALWTFDVALSWTAFGRFLLGSIGGVLIAGLTIGILSDGLHLPMTVAAPLATGIMIVYNFVMARWAVTRRALLEQPH